MSTDPLKVIVLGSGNTGSGAIYDYLKNRPDFVAPLQQEFRLIQDPGGLVDLHSSIGFQFHTNRASSAIKEFQYLCERAAMSKNGYRKGLDYVKDIENFEEKVDQFVDNITTVKYDGMPFCERSKLSLIKAYIYEKKRVRAKRKGGKPSVGTIRVPVNEGKFLVEAKKFLDSIFIPSKNGSADEYRSVVINQGGSFWAPESSTQYFGERRKAIVVTRDPRGIYSSFQMKGYAYPGDDVHLFCNWFKEIMSHVDYSEWNNEYVRQVQFEDFVLNFEEEKKKLDQFLGIPNLESSINIDRSAFNAEKFQNRLTYDDLKVIEKELSDYLYF